jgi:phosphate transport system substrate-binding protein
MKRRQGLLTSFTALLALMGACKEAGEDAGEQATTSDPADGRQLGPARGAEVIQIDGSSTVFPISQAVAEEWQKATGGRVTVGMSGTGGGFKKLCRGEIAIADASRPITDAEQAQCRSAGIDFVELPVAFDGLVVVVNPRNEWVDHITVEELRHLWAPEAQGKITRWSQVRRRWPERDIHLFGPGVDSGTYDYFTQAVVGEEHASRGDFTSSEDDNVLVQGVSSDSAALGFFGYAYYVENKDKLKLVPIEDSEDENGAGPILPSLETVANGTYQPLSRPIFIYVSNRAMTRPEVKGFIDFYLHHARELIQEVGYIPLPDRAYELARKRFAEGKTGSVFHGSQVGVSVSDLLSGGA